MLISFRTAAVGDLVRSRLTRDFDFLGPARMLSVLAVETLLPFDVLDSGNVCDLREVAIHLYIFPHEQHGARWFHVGNRTHRASMPDLDLPDWVANVDYELVWQYAS